MMMKEDVVGILKKFVSDSTSLKFKPKQAIFQDLSVVIKNKELSEQIVGEVLKLIVPIASLRYNTPLLHRLVGTLVCDLSESYPDQTLFGLAKVVTAVFRNYKQSSKSIAKSLVNAWKWLIVSSNKFDSDKLKAVQANNPSNIGLLTEAFSVSSFLIFTGGSAQTKKLATLKFANFLKKSPHFGETFFGIILKNDDDSKHICFISLILKTWKELKVQSNIDRYVPLALEFYVKTVLSTKKKPDPLILESCQSLFCLLTSDVFEQNLFPHVQRYLLRSPEFVIEAVGFIFSQLSIDVSKHATEISKLLSVQLYAKDEKVQEESAIAFKYLARRCSDAEICSKLVASLFLILNGTDVKLSNAVQRCGVLKGIENLSFVSINDSKKINSLTVLAVESFITLLKEEINDSTLEIALKSLSVWARKFYGEFSSKLTDWFKEGINLKTTTPSIRNSYLKAMNASFNDTTLAFAEPLLPVLVSTVEKASKQGSQFALILDALPASLLLLRYCSAVGSESTLKSIWPLVVDKKLFSNDKFLEHLDDDGFLLIVGVVQKVLLEQGEKINEEHSKQFYRLLLLAATSRAHATRAAAKALIKRLLVTLSGATLSLSLIVEFKEMLSASCFDKLFEDASKSLTSKDENANLTSENFSNGSKILCECFSSICKVQDADDVSVKRICFDSLPVCCHPRLQAFDNSDWLKILQFYSLDPLTFTKNNSAELISFIWNLENEVCYSAAYELSLICADEFFSNVLKSCWNNLNETKLVEIPLEDVLIMKTPEGVLYDRSVLDAAKQEVKQTNLKRESKLYSYKEQLAAIALEKELLEKKRKEGKIKEELTPKQKEAEKQQLAKESAVRNELLQLWKPAEKALKIVHALIKANHENAKCSIVELQHHFWPLLKSPLAASIVVDCILRLRDACFEDSHDSAIGSSIIFADLRLEKTACDLDATWCQEKSLVQAKRALHELYQRVHKIARQESETGYEDMKSSTTNLHPLESACFAFCFPLINYVLRNRHASFPKENEFLTEVVRLCRDHVSESCWKLENFNVTSLPIVDLVSVMLKVIGTTEVGELQQSACHCVVEMSTTVAQFHDKFSAETIVEVVKTVLSEMLHPNDLVREYSLTCLDKLSTFANGSFAKGTIRDESAERIYILRFDPNEQNMGIADKLWDDGKYQTTESLCELLLEDVLHHSEVIRECSTDAVIKCLESHPSALPKVLAKLSHLYDEKLKMTPPVYDDFARLVAEGGIDQWEARAGVAVALRKIAPLLTGKDLTLFFNIIIPDGLKDRSTDVSSLMLLAAVEGVKCHGKEQISKLLPMFDKQLDETNDDRRSDTLRQSIVVLLGTLAQHLDKDDPKVKPIVAKLIEALSTPAQSVQQAVANCLPPLVPAIKDQVPQMVEKLLCLLFEANQYGERRGAAYGLAGLVKGMGISSLRQFDIMTKLNDAMTDKKQARRREGALLALEMLCNMLGKLFEPYVVNVLPNLLLCFGDTDQHVREAADECAKAVMRQLSAHGVKLVLPALLKALEEDSWRTKCGSVELLGAMAYCAPKQLSSCLPSIVPKLIEVLSDTHMRVQKAGEQALKHIGQVIKNPEIQAIVHVLLGALEDPAKKTASCLQTLLHTKFVHYIDAPSLALIMPVVHRAFDDRSTETRRSAAQIVGNIYSLTDQKDVEPYLPEIMPGLKKCLLDPVPEVRSVAAKALGAMVRATREANFQDLLPWLQQMLTSSNSSVDRSGAAQGLSEVIGGLGESHLQRIMPDIIQTAEAVDVEPHVRDGYIMMYIYLPVVFGDKFLPYLSKVIPSILTALAEETEFVRETALRCGQRIINMYCENAIPLLLPSLERGLFDDNWRIRFSSVQLLGDLLFKISGVTGKMTTESGEDDTFGTEASSKTVLNALGADRRNRVLSGLYISRSDVALTVRQAAGHVWKVIVSNTPKTLKEILPTLFQLLLGCLSSSNYDKQQVAARCLGELVKKMGERILVDVVPVLEGGLKSAQPDQRQGVCVALSEIMTNTTKETVLMYAGNLIPSIRTALSDPLPEVRQAAASTFSVLHTAIGTQAMDEVLTPLLGMLDDKVVGPYVLDGLQQVMALKSRVLLPYMVPKLTTPPVKTKALSHLASVSGPALNKHLNKVLTALISSFAESVGTDQEAEELQNCVAVLVSVKDEPSVGIVLDMLLPKSYDDESTKVASAILLDYFCQNSKAPLMQFVSQIIKGSLNFYTSENDKILAAATDALTSVVKSLDGKEQIEEIKNIRQTVRNLKASLKNDDALLPGFCRDKSVQPVLTVFREAILNGGTDLKETASYGLSEVISASATAALKPHVVNITGPLIRVLGDRYPPNVKSAILSTLALLLEKVSLMLKPFLPQLQTTFLKALNEPTSRTVRLNAAKALAQLIVIHPKIDTLLTDLCKNIKSSDDAQLRETYLIALRLCLNFSMDKISDETKSLVDSTIRAYISSTDDIVRIAASEALESFNS